MLLLLASAFTAHFMHTLKLEQLNGDVTVMPFGSSQGRASCVW
jgi:hypothetical protein